MVLQLLVALARAALEAGPVDHAYDPAAGRDQNKNNQNRPVPLSRNHPDNLSSERQNPYAGDQACPSRTLAQLLNKNEERAEN